MITDFEDVNGMAQTEERDKLKGQVYRILPDTIEKIVMNSEISCYMMPEPGTEIEQELTIQKDGTVSLKHIYCTENWEKKKSKSEKWQIDGDEAEAIFKRSFCDFLDYVGNFWYDAGSWSMKMYFQSGSVMNRACSSGEEPKGFSEYIREMLGRNDLLVCGR